MAPISSLQNVDQAESQIVRLFDLPVSNATMEEAIECIHRFLDEDFLHHIAVVNTNKFWQARHVPGMYEILKESDMLVPEFGAVWAANMLGTPLKENVRGVGLFLALIPKLEDWGVPVYFLGAKEESLNALVKRLRIEHPKLNVVGARNGFFDRDEEQKIVCDINASDAAALFVAMGSPRQEFFINRHRRELLPKIAMGVGGSFDVLAGLKKDAPTWTHCGIEWLYRLWLDPKNLMGRYLRVHPWFVCQTLRARMVRGRR